MSDDTPTTQPATPPTGPSLAGRIATAPVPLWLVGTIVVVLLGAGAFVYFGQSNVDLGNAVSDARSIGVKLVICNEVVDDRGINPRQAELALQQTFQDDFHVEKATVAIDRIDCEESR